MLCVILWPGVCVGCVYRVPAPRLPAIECAVLSVLQVDEGLVANSARMGAVMRAHMDALAAAHPSVKECRQIGLFGCIELQRDRGGTPLVPYAGSHPVVPKLAAFLRDNGLFTLISGSLLMCNPPLCITEAQVADAFAVIDRALALVDAVVEGGEGGGRGAVEPRGPQ